MTSDLLATGVLAAAILAVPFIDLWFRRRRDAALSNRLVAALEAFINIATHAKLPESFTLRMQIEQIAPDATKVDEEPMPADLLDYIGQWDSGWARKSQEHRARDLKRKLGSWTAAFAYLQKENEG